MSESTGIELDASRVIERLGRRIGELEIENAKLDALVHQLAAKAAPAEPEK